MRAGSDDGLGNTSPLWICGRLSQEELHPGGNRLIQEASIRVEKPEKSKKSSESVTVSVKTLCYDPNSGWRKMDYKGGTDGLGR